MGSYFRVSGSITCFYKHISDVRYLHPTSNIQYQTSARARARDRVRDRARARDRARDIGRRIYILDVRYRFRKH